MSQGTFMIFGVLNFLFHTRKNIFMLITQGRLAFSVSKLGKYAKSRDFLEKQINCFSSENTKCCCVKDLYRL